MDLRLAIVLPGVLQGHLQPLYDAAPDDTREKMMLVYVNNLDELIGQLRAMIHNYDDNNGGDLAYQELEGTFPGDFQVLPGAAIGPCKSQQQHHHPQAQHIWILIYLPTYQQVESSGRLGQVALRTWWPFKVDSRSRWLVEKELLNKHELKPASYEVWMPGVKRIKTISSSGMINFPLLEVGR